jgi:hypothetical protein
MKQLILIIFNIYDNLFISSPLLLYLVLIALNTILSVYYNNPYLCDGEGLEELTNKLASLYKEYNEASKEYEQYSDLLEQASKRPDCVKDNGIERYLTIKKDYKNIETVSILFKIRMVEANIKLKSPNFASAIKREWHEYF